MRWLDRYLSELGQMTLVTQLVVDWPGRVPRRYQAADKKVARAMHHRCASATVRWHAELGFTGALQALLDCDRAEMKVRAGPLLWRPAIEQLIELNGDAALVTAQRMEQATPGYAKIKLAKAEKILDRDGREFRAVLEDKVAPLLEGRELVS